MKNVIHNALSHMQRYTWWRGLILFILVASIFTWFLANDTFADPDSFYHIGMADYLWEHKSIPHQFPWLAHTTLSQHYTDHHFLYHVMLIPFVTLLSPFVGAKLLTILFDASVITAIYFLLQRNRVPLPMAWAASLLVCSGFLFRLGLVKAPGVSLLFLLAGAALLIHSLSSKKPKRALWLFPLSFAFVWGYGGFIVLLLLALCVAGGVILYGLLHAYTRKQWKRVLMYQSFVVLCVALGMFFGTLIHPSFPDNLYLLWGQVVDIGIVNQKDVISVGREWYPPNLGNVARDQIWLVMLLCISVVAAARHWKRVQPETFGLAAFALILILFTVRSQRYIEYAIPWALIAAAFLMRDSGVAPHAWKWLRGRAMHWGSTPIQKWARREYVVFAQVLLGCTFGGAIFVLSLTQTLKGTHNDLRGGIEYSRAQASAQWLANNTPAGTQVYTSDWDVFPELFYYNQKDYYSVGLDPTFMYRFDPELYWEWFNINTGKKLTGITNAIEKNFHSSYIYVEADNTALQSKLVKEGRSEKVYADDFAVIYHIITPTSPTK